MKTHVRDGLALFFVLILAQTAMGQEAAPGSPSLSAEGTKETMARTPEPIQQKPQFEPVLPPIPESLTEMIDVAMRNNPEMRVAEAALRQAEAELNRVRLEVAKEVARIYGELNRLREHREFVRERFRLGTLSGEEVRETEARLAELEAQARYLLGLGGPPHLMPTEPLEFPPEMVRRPRPKLDEDAGLATSLGSPLAIEFDGEMLRDILDFMADYLDMNFVVDQEVESRPVTVNLRDVTVGQALLALTDRVPDLCFVVREGYILATTRERAETMNAPTIPADVPFFIPVEEEPFFAGVAEALEILGDRLRESLEKGKPLEALERLLDRLHENAAAEEVVTELQRLLDGNHKAE